jgi:flagellar biogenesis protein FliO
MTMAGCATVAGILVALASVLALVVRAVWGVLRRSFPAERLHHAGNVHRFER